MANKNLFLKDYLVSRIISTGKEVKGYGNIYYKANEDLIDLCLDVDFADKEVLSVLASGDQVFTSRLLDTKKTDAFDYNYFALYYFYLRIWSIEYRDELYPRILDGDNRWLASLLNMVKPRNLQEHQALVFFKCHVKDGTNLEGLFFDDYRQPDGRTLYNTAKELEDCISPELTFNHVNLFENFYLDATYDIVLLSNVLEWARNDPKKLEIAHRNLERLVNKDGVVICSSLLNRPKQELEKEREIFTSFDYERVNKGYYYIKK